ncbi:unnamed protein product [Blepharisma stoltei]|uniref:Uncharacterized protein n=1 Tax=Blepharisma stoltei TaxID=1481888 RepID=A0AAU9JIM0_9CILI|nr:unnamed protein product [Blepharisma stoltei]
MAWAQGLILFAAADKGRHLATLNQATLQSPDEDKSLSSAHLALKLKVNESALSIRHSGFYSISVRKKSKATQFKADEP